jgi:Sec-independent protein translocase protein TatA
LTKSPFLLLQEHVTQVLDRLRGSDIRTLNRKLKRAFDITELSSMSNSIIENVLLDVDNLENRFLWVKTTTQPEQDFFPLVDLFKTMLKELGVLKSTMNELQAEYVKKIEANEQRVEEEIIQKRQLKKQQQQLNQMLQSKSTTSVPNTTPLAWFTSIFSNPSTTPTIQKNTSSEATTSSHHYDKGSTLTKTTTNSSTLIPNHDEDDYSTLRNRIIPEEETQPVPATSSNHSHHYARTFPRQSMDKRRPIPYLPTTNQPLILSSSQSTGTNRSSPSIPIRNNNVKRNLHHRMNIDYEGIGPATIRPIPSDRDNTTTFSSSWLGGK